MQLRETCALYRTKLPCLVRTLVVKSRLSARRCLQTIYRDSRIRDITVNLAYPSSSEIYAAARRRCIDHNGNNNDDNSDDNSQSAALKTANGTCTHALLLRQYCPAEFRVINMLSGAQFSEALGALEDNITTAREHLQVLQLGLATTGPRPYQDSLAHQACVSRLRRLLHGQEEEGNEELQSTVPTAAAARVVLWPRLRELHLSCGIIGGELEDMARCLGR